MQTQSSSASFISSVEQLKYLAANRPKQTKTYRTTQEVAEANYQQMLLRGGSRLKPMTVPQMEELAAYLDVPLEDITIAKPCIEENICPQCSRLLTFTDLVHEAVVTSNHSKAFMADVLVGKMGPILTITGLDDDTHRFNCINCGDRSILVREGDCYKSGCSGNVYAHCAW